MITIQKGSDLLPKGLFKKTFILPRAYRFIVGKKDSLYYLKKGKLDFFAIALKQRETDERELNLEYLAEECVCFKPHFFPGSLHYLTTIEEGKIFLPFSFESTMVVLAIARDDCEIANENLEEMREIAARSPTIQVILLDNISDWIKSLENHCHQITDSLSANIIPPNEFIPLKAGTTFKCQNNQESNSLFWLKIYEGKAYANDLTAIQKNTLYPIHANQWFTCRESGTVELFVSEADLTLNKEFWQGITLFQQHVLSYLKLSQHIEKEKIQIETERARERDALLYDLSFDNLENLFELKEHLGESTNKNLLFRTCQRVGDELGLQFIASDFELDNSEEALQNLCMNSHIYYRRVRLFETWWKSETFPFVAFYGEKKLPIALLPASKGGYRGIDLNTSIEFTIDAEEAKKISPYGYMFYRQLKEGKLNVSNIWTFIFSQRRNEWLKFLSLIVCGSLVNLFLPLFTGLMFDNVIPHRNLDLLWEIVLGTIVITVSTLIFNFGREVLILKLESLTDHDMDMAIWQRLIQLPMQFFRKYSIYDLFTFTGAIGSIRKFLLSHTINVIFDVFFGVVYFILMFYYSWTLSLVGLGLLGIEIISIFVPVYFAIQYERDLLSKQIESNNKMLEMIQALTKVRLAGAEARLFRRWEKAFTDMTRVDLKSLYLQLKSGGFQDFWSNAGSLILYSSVVILLFFDTSQSSEQLTLGSFLAFISVFSLFSSSLTALGGTLLNIIGIIPLWEKTKAFAEAEPEESAKKPSPGHLLGEIRIERLTFSYRDDLPPVLKNFSLTIKAGESIALVGKSGCGKSTLLKLLLGFEKSNNGTIFYDNKDIKGLNLQGIRRQLGVVLQSGAIFDGTLLENINSERHYSEEQVQQALHLIGADSFIQELPMGIHTVLTNGGASLSGGQKQLILLARAIVGKPKILILDEATSALDNHKQKIIYENLKRLPMTQIIIAQRLDTIQYVDKIYLIEEGEMTDSGTFSELSNRPGLFSELLNQAIKYE